MVGERAQYDVIVVGAGPAGLSTALVLARARRRVLVLDDGHARNRHAVELHNFLTRDGVAPSELRQLGRDELARYPNIKIFDGRAVGAEQLQGGGFLVRYARIQEDLLNGHTQFVHTATCIKLMLATGMRDVLPRLEGLERFYGKSVHHCPYCDAFGHSDKRLIAYGRGNAGVGLSFVLRNWSARVVACTDGELPDEEKLHRAAETGVLVFHQRVLALEGDHGRLQRVRFIDGASVECDALFFNTGQVQRSDLPEKLGCRMRPDGGVETSDRQATCVPGLYLAGDADKDVQFSIVAAAEGATAAVAMNRELQDEGVYAAERTTSKVVT